MNIRELLDSFGRAFVFKQWRLPLRSYLLKAGYETTPYAFFGSLFIFVLLLTSGLFLAYIVPALGPYSPPVQAIATLFFFIAVPLVLIALVVLAIYFYLNIKIYRRINEMELILPEYLQLVVTNLKSGMNFEQSLWAAARPEFGILSQEITLVSKKVLTGNDTTEALNEFVDRYDSPTLRRNFTLIISEVQSGGEIVKVIERVIVSLKKTKDLKDELNAQVLNYMIFIAVIVIVLAPILFALANTLLSIVIGFASVLGGSVGNTASLGSQGAFLGKIAQLSENGDHIQTVFRTFSYWAIGLIAFFSSLIISVIEKGDIRGGIRYVPLFTISALVIFGISLKVLMLVFGGVVG
jgi:pilus assembly protein TadC